jgi:Holliday junction DNA helicase RuvA
MISHLEGRVIDTNARFCVLDVSGVGYKVSSSEEVLRNLKNGQNVAFWTHLAVREDALDLYGFPDRESLDLFQMLITVSGIGPKTALGVMNVATPLTLRRAVASGDLAYLTKVSGIGRKLAEKIILELREKLEIYAEATSDDMAGEADVLEALKSLGYSERESRDALKKLSGDNSGKSSDTSGTLSTGEKVKKALKILGGSK